MKKSILLLTFFTSIFMFSQNDTLNAYNLNKLKDSKSLKEFGKKFENRQIFNYFLDSSGNTYKIGDIFKIGVPQKLYGVNESLYFSGIWGCFDAIETSIPYTNFISSLKLPAQGWVGKNCKIEKIGIRKSFGFATPFIVLECEGQKINVISIDFCLENKELVNPNAPISSEEAIAKLKSLKEKLDLELITKEEYDIHKKELSKYIK